MRPRARGPRPADGGFTLVELIVATALITAIGAAMALIVFTSAASYRGATTEAQLEARVSRTLERIAQELRFVEPGLLDPKLSAPLSASYASYQRVVDFGEGGPVLSAPLRIAFEVDPAEADDGSHATNVDGEDDDGDGLVDEGRVVWSENAGLPGERRVVWSEGVPELFEGEEENGLDDNGNGLIDESGLCFQLDGGTLVIRLSLSKRDPDGRVVTRSSETSVRLDI